ncbi:hypothetical protein [Actinomadura darangshiensis]|nr:hypothetical protein [Actinomadura darangshiensis]
MGDTSGRPETERSEPGGEAESLTGRALNPDKRPRAGEGPDVYLNVPQLKVDEISLEVENLEAHVSLVAQVLDMLRLNVGADVFLGRVKLEIKGVEAEAQLEVRLDNVAVIVDRVLTTLDRNPEILQHIGRGVESAARDIGAGTGTAVGEVGRGARGAVADVGRGAGGAVENVGEGAGGAVRDVGKGAGGAVQDVGKGAGEGVREGAGGAVENVGEGAGGAVGDVGKGAGGAVQDVGKGTGEGVRDVGSAGDAVEDVGERTGGAIQNGAAASPDRNDTPPGDTHSKDAEDAPAADDGDQDAATLRSALHETEDSVRDLGRALLRMISQQSKD